MTQLTVPGIPFPLAPSPDSTWMVDAGTGQLSVRAAPHSDIFVDPGGEEQRVNAETQLNAVTLLAPAPDSDFQFSAQVTVEFLSAFDAGVLLLWLNERYWAKLCFEHSPAGQAMVVSVVNRHVSDDANAFIVEDHNVWLRISRVGSVFAFHGSTDGTVWHLVRVFALPVDGVAPSIGFEAQSPTGDGCAVAFTDVHLSMARLDNLRDGS